MSALRSAEGVRIEGLDLRDVVPSADPGEMPEFALISCDWLHIDHRYQRLIESRRSQDLIRKILEEFDWQKFQPITVVMMDEGYFVVIDGQHRAVAAIHHPKVTEVPAWVLTAPEIVQQARTFIAINQNRVAMTQLNLYKAQLVAGDAEAQLVEDICKAARVEIVLGTIKSGAAAARTTVAVSSIRTALKGLGEASVVAALSILADASEATREMIRSEMIKAVVSLVAANSAKLDRQRMVSVLSSVKFEELTDAARQVKTLFGGTTIGAISRAVAERYNKGLAAERRIEVQVMQVRHKSAGHAGQTEIGRSEANRQVPQVEQGVVMITTPSNGGSAGNRQAEPPPFKAGSLPAKRSTGGISGTREAPMPPRPVDLPMPRGDVFDQPRQRRCVSCPAVYMSTAIDDTLCPSCRGRGLKLARAS